LTVAVAASAQNQKNRAPYSSVAGSKSAIGLLDASLVQVDAADRGTPVWSDDISTPANWTFTTGTGHNPAVGGSNPGWQVVTALPTTLTSQGTYATLSSTSGGNFLFIDSDAPGGTATQDAIATYSGPAIDLTSAGTNYLSLRWQQISRKFYEIHTVGISTNGGSTWTDIEVNSTYGANVGNYLGHQALPNPHTINLPVGAIFDAHVSGGGTLNNIRIRFMYQGAWDWYWAIDDIAFVPTPDHELMVTGMETFAKTKTYGLAAEGVNLPTYTIHTSQIDPAGYGFAAQIYNEGSVTQPSSRGVYTVMQGASTVFTSNGVGTTNHAPLTTLSDSSSTAFMPTATVATYMSSVAIDYTNLVNDEIPGNNTRTIQPMQVTAKYHGRAPLAFSSSNMFGGYDSNGDPNPFIATTAIHVYTAKDLEGIRVALNEFTDAGAIVYPWVEEIDPTTGNSNIIYEGSQVFGGGFTTTASNISTASSVVYVDVLFQNRVPLTPGMVYNIGIEHVGPEQLVLMTGTLSAPDLTNFIFRPDPAGVPTWYFTNSTPMIFGMLDVGLNVAEEKATGMNLGQNFPNPTNGTTTINYGLLENASQVNIEIVDVTGKLVMSINEGSKPAGNYNVTFNTNQLSEGVYMYTLTDGTNRLTKRMVVTK
jgi:hypothetical protein